MLWGKIQGKNTTVISITFKFIQNYKSFPFGTYITTKIQPIKLNNTYVTHPCITEIEILLFSIHLHPLMRTGLRTLEDNLLKEGNTVPLPLCDGPTIMTPMLKTHSRFSICD